MCTEHTFPRVLVGGTTGGAHCRMCRGSEIGQKSGSTESLAAGGRLLDVLEEGQGWCFRGLDYCTSDVIACFGLEVPIAGETGHLQQPYDSNNVCCKFYEDDLSLRPFLEKTTYLCATGPKETDPVHRYALQHTKYFEVYKTTRIGTSLRSQLTKPQVVQVFLGLGSSGDCCLYSKEGPAAVGAVAVVSRLLPETTTSNLRPTRDAAADTGEVIMGPACGGL